MLMDKPLHIFPDRRFEYNTSPEDEDTDEDIPYNSPERLEFYVENDMKDEFVKAINGFICMEEVPCYLLDQLYEHDAVKCSMAMLSGETSRVFDVNATFYDANEESPLHKAAYYSSYKMVKLFLDNGANPDVRCECKHSGMQGLLPLDAVLCRLWKHSVAGAWTLKESIFKLIYRFCGVDERKSLETIRFLS